MKCQACGADTTSDSVYCPSCGERLDGGGENTAAPTNAERFQESVQSRQNNEDPAEEDLWQGRYSGKAMYGTWLLGALISVGMIVAMVFFPPAIIPLVIAIIALWIILALVLAYKKLSVHYELTSQRFIHRSGILKRVTDRIEVIDIDDVTYEQGLIQRMFNVGTVRISSSDRTHPELVLAGIEDVANVADVIDKVRREERMRRGLHIEAI